MKKLPEQMVVDVPEGFEKQKTRILYIGKATNGEFRNGETKAYRESRRSEFMRFMKNIVFAIDKRADPAKCVAWSNIIKQGVLKGNPRELSPLQKRDAIRALRREVALYKPTHIVLVSGDYAEDIPMYAFEIANECKVTDERKYRTGLADRREYWYRPAWLDYPPIIWLSHPQAKSKKYREGVLAFVRERAASGDWM